MKMYLFHLLIVQQQEHQLTDHNRIIVWIFLYSHFDLNVKTANCGRKISHADFK